MNRIILMLMALTGILYSGVSQAFTCQLNGQTIPGNSSADIRINLQPTLSLGDNTIVDLSSFIQCKNDIPSMYTDPVRIKTGSTYHGALSSFRGSLIYFNTTYDFPLNNETAWVYHTWGTMQAWQVALALTPTSAAGGVVIKAGSLIAQLVLEKMDSINGDIETITWNVYANNDVVIPTGGCDVSARDITITLPTYPGSAAVPLKVHCKQDQKIGYYLSGNTQTVDESIFTNTATNSPAQGIGVQLLRYGNALRSGPANITSMGTVGTTPVDLGLTATYALTHQQVTAGNVQSIIGVTFVYQ